MVYYRVDKISTQLHELTRLNTLDMIEAFKLDLLPVPERMLQFILKRPAQDISQAALGYNAAIQQQGLQAASGWITSLFNETVVGHGVERIPKDGPLLVVSNHPGMTDALVIIESLPRNDVKILVQERPLLQLLKNMQEHFIVVTNDPRQRVRAIREAAAHLHGGGTVLLFPAGKIEPDPALRSSAADTLNDWSASVNWFARRVPHLQVLPVTVGGVISHRAAQNPITRLYRTPARKDWVAATLMVIMQRYRDTHVTLSYGHPLTASEDKPDILPEVQAQMQRLMAAYKPIQ